MASCPWDVQTSNAAAAVKDPWEIVISSAYSTIEVFLP
jgi:hypothetical protein